jgi:hypothetical protein
MASKPKHPAGLPMTLGNMRELGVPAAFNDVRCHSALIDYRQAQGRCHRHLWEYGSRRGKANCSDHPDRVRGGGRPGRHWPRRLSGAAGW